MYDRVAVAGVAFDEARQRTVVVGTYQGTLQGAGATLASTPGAAFLLVLDSHGNLVTTRSIDQASAGAVALDASGGIWLTGSFANTSDFGSGMSLTSAGASDVFVASFDASGSTRWARGFGGQWDDGGTSIVVDASGRVLVAGSLDGHMLGEDLLGWHAFVSLFDSAGTRMWIDVAQDYDNTAPSLHAAFEGNGNILVEGAGEPPFPDGHTLYSSFLARIDGTGAGLATFNMGLAMLTDLATTPSGLVLAGEANNVGGYPDAGPDFGCGPIVNPLQADQAFAVALHAPGSCVWSQSWGGVAFPDRASADHLAVSKRGVWVSGDFQGTMFIGGTAYTYDAGGSSAFLARLAP
jgi:hypothetical protein